MGAPTAIYAGSVTAQLLQQSLSGNMQSPLQKWALVPEPWECPCLLLDHG